MSRERMVTRTIIITKGTMLGLNIETKEAATETFSIPGKHTGQEALKKLQKDYIDKLFQPVAVTEYTNDEVLYGMSESDFLKHAKALMPRKKYGNYKED